MRLANRDAISRVTAAILLQQLEDSCAAIFSKDISFSKLTGSEKFT